MTDEVQIQPELIRRFFDTLEDALRAEDVEDHVQRRIMNRLLFGTAEGPTVRHMFITAGIDEQKVLEEAREKSTESQVSVHWHPARAACRNEKHESYQNGELRHSWGWGT